MIEHKAPFVLTDEDKQSRLWGKLMEHWQDKLAAFRAANDTDKDTTETAKLRGRIAELKANLELNSERRVIGS